MSANIAYTAVVKEIVHPVKFAVDNAGVWLRELLEVLISDNCSFACITDRLLDFQKNVLFHCKSCFKESNISDETDAMILTKVGVYLAYFTSIATTDKIVGNLQNIKLLACVSVFLSPRNCTIRKLLCTDRGLDWFATKTNIVKGAVKRLSRENPKEMKHIYLMLCALELEDVRLQRAVERCLFSSLPVFANICHSVEEAYWNTMPCQNTAGTGANQRKRDPPGQCSVYIPPGDPMKESYRLATFIQFPRTSAANPHDLAKISFYYTGYKDRVKCFSCGLCVENWMHGDDVQSPRWHKDDCQRMRGEECGNIPIADVMAQFAGQGRQTERTRIVELQNSFPCLYPVSPHMRNEDSRFETFDHRWPQSRVRATPRQIAKAGFFFFGERDRVKCWYCNGGLQNWDPDDEPWSEHAKWFPTCELLLQHKGPDFVHRMVSLFPNLPRPVLRGPFNVPPSGSRGRGQKQSLSSVIDPQVKSVCSQLNEAMKSTTVENAKVMGFDYRKIRRLIKRRLENHIGLYSSVESLVEDLIQYPPCHHSGSNAKTIQNNHKVQSLKLNGARNKPDEKENAATLLRTTVSVEARIQELQEERKCKIYLDQMADVVFVPCGHLCSCTECTQALRKCPICRMKIEKYIHTYFS
ncbi:unnamed protein product [Clavelina lepadiformis]|uniref:RING-type domain-containing protein n=1 Tax=Clavelina lepadiformis TaxID=159417 RepID=A0ABP0F0T1_CLALP